MFSILLSFQETNGHRIETLTEKKIAADLEHQTKTNCELVRDHGTFQRLLVLAPFESKKKPCAITVSKFR